MGFSYANQSVSFARKAKRVSSLTTMSPHRMKPGTFATISDVLPIPAGEKRSTFALRILTPFLRHFVTSTVSKYHLDGKLLQGPKATLMPFTKRRYLVSAEIRKTQGFVGSSDNVIVLRNSTNFPGVSIALSSYPGAQIHFALPRCVADIMSGVAVSNANELQCKVHK